MDKSKHRIEKQFSQSLRNWEKIETPETREMKPDAWVEMGWGRLVFGHTFGSSERIATAMSVEGRDRRDIAIYIIDPHVVISMAPEKLFLDPSHTYRLWFHDYKGAGKTGHSCTARRLSTKADAEQVNRIYAACGMKGADPDFILDRHADKLRTYLVAESPVTGEILGTVTGVDHVHAFNDPENGASLWSLAVDPQSDVPGVGSTLVRHLVEHYFTRGRSFVDISVMHSNESAIHLYEKIGFQRIPVFCIKRKNPINEPLFMGHKPDANLNVYATIITDEARRRGIEIEILDEQFNLFKLTLGGRSVTCRESLSDMTSAVAMARCDDKRLTSRTLKKAGLKVPLQQLAGKPEENQRFLKTHGTLVVKPARGEQGEGISVDITDAAELEKAVAQARQICEDVILETYFKGEDLRIIVINYEVVAAAVRRPPAITGTGEHTVKELIEKYNRRRLAATEGESRIPLDEETERCLQKEGYDYDSVPEEGRIISVRKTANLHTGGTIHDVTGTLSPKLAQVAEKAARALEIPVTGLDFMVKDAAEDEYVIIEANERPGLANHEPQPTAEKFIDMLFPETVISSS